MYSTMRPEVSASIPASRGSSQLLRFVVAGGVCTLLQYLILVAGVEVMGIDAVLASATGYLVSAVLNYALNRRYTFRSATAHRVALVRFAVVVASGMALNIAGMRLLHTYLRWHYLYAQVLVTLLVLLWNFAWHRYWTFAPVRRQPGS